MATFGAKVPLLSVVPSVSALSATMLNTPSATVPTPPCPPDELKAGRDRISIWVPGSHHRVGLGAELDSSVGKHQQGFKVNLTN